MRGSLQYIFLVVLFLMLSACSSDDSNYAPVINAWNQPLSKQGDYLVQKGDTLYSIAWAYGLDYQDLAKINHLKMPYQVSPGQSIHLVKENKSVNSKDYVKSKPKHEVIPTKSLSKKIESPILETWRWPADGKVVSTFSLSRPVNKGIDISGKAGQAVNAANSGVVVYSGNGIPGYGNLILIKHNNAYLSAYAHNKNNLVKEGQRVSQGQKIATMGLGSLNKPELHFEIRFKGKPINPIKKLPKEA